HHERVFERRQKKYLAYLGSPGRALIRAGEWTGKSIMDKGPPEFLGEYSVRARFTIEDEKVISGEYEYWVDPANMNSPQKHSPPATLDIHGGFNDENFLTIWL